MLFKERHIGISEVEKSQMLDAVGCATVDELIEKTIPSKIRLKTGLEFSKSITESKWLADVGRIAELNKTYKTYIGLGYHDTISLPLF